MSVDLTVSSDHQHVTSTKIFWTTLCAKQLDNSYKIRFFPQASATLSGEFWGGPGCCAWSPGGRFCWLPLISRIISGFIHSINVYLAEVSTGDTIGNRTDTIYGFKSSECTGRHAQRTPNHIYKYKITHDACQERKAEVDRDAVGVRFSLREWSEKAWESQVMSRERLLGGRAVRTGLHEAEEPDDEVKDCTAAGREPGERAGEKTTDLGPGTLVGRDRTSAGRGLI